MEALVDSFGRRHSYLRISVTDRCNLRCAYCMPEGGIERRDRAEILSFGEITRLARVFAALGVRKIRLTGGEPLVRRNLAELVAGLAAVKGIETLALTTNGVLLAGQASALKAAGLRRLNISLDTLRPERFERIALRPFHGRVLAGIDAALEAGLTPLKLNVVVRGGVNDDELTDFVAYVRERPIEVRFIEFMPFKANHWNSQEFVPYETMRRAIEASYRLTPVAADGSEERPVAQVFQVEGHRGTVGFISAMTESFCSRCDRLRLTAEGGIKTCLFTSPEPGLREAMRTGASDEDLAMKIRRVVAGKGAAHPPVEELAELGNESMIEIGG